ncbi:MAG TPA: hypothetical protein PKV51_09085 [Bacillota bacterium]|nr:hypothetical protein [Bacillota bacterium]HPP86220.1 hypothetical protein [Bacillota bacterium]
MPKYPATDSLNAFAIGIASDLAATGAHPVIKQLTNEQTGSEKNVNQTERN